MVSEKQTTILLGVLVILTVAALSEACSCLAAHPQQHYCNSDYVIKAVVRNYTAVEEDYVGYYDVEVLKIYKDPNLSDFTSFDETSNKTMVRIQTSIFGSMCGVTLQMNTTYILGNPLYNEHISIGLCSLIVPYDDLTKRQMQFFNHRYGKHCDCEINYCGTFEKCRPPTPNECFADYNAHPIECSDRFAMCRRNKETKSCQWTDNQSNQLCQHDWMKKKLRHRH